MRKWLVGGGAIVVFMAVLSVWVQGANADACGLIHPPGYADRVNAALQSTRDVWGNELINSPLGPTFAGASSYLAPMSLFHDPGGLAPKTGIHYVPFGQPDLTSSNSVTNPFGDPTPSPEVWTGGPRPWVSTAEIALHVADGSQYFSNYMLATNHANGINSNQVTVQVGANGQEIYGSCQGRLQMGKLTAGMPILTTAYTDAQGMQYEQESFAVRAPELPSSQGSGNLVSFIKLTVRRGGASATRANVNFVMGNAPLTLDTANNRLIDNNNPANPGEVDIVFSPGATYTSPALNYSIDVADGQPRTVYLVRLNQPTTSVGPGLTADSGRYQAGKDAIQAYWNNVLGQGATFSVPDQAVMDAQRNLLIQSILLGLNYSLANNYSGTPFIPENYWPLTTLGEYGFGNYEEIGLENFRDFRENDGTDAPRPGYDNMFRGVKMESAAEWYWRTRDAADFDRFFTPLFSQWASDFQRQMGENNGLLAQEPWATDLGTKCFALPYTHAHAWRGLASVVQVWKTIAADAGLAQTYEPVALQLGRNIADAIAAGQTTLSDGSVFIPPCLRNSGPSPDPQAAHITSTQLGAYWNIVMPDAFASGLIVPRSEQATGVLRYLDTHGSRLLGLLRFGPYGTNVTSGYDNVYLWNTVRFLAANDQSDQLVLTLYGLLGAGLTPGTYSSGEGSTIAPVPGEYYRQITRPPNSTTTASALETLRLMLVHTTTEPRGSATSGAPTGLELAFGTARSWLETGKQITVSGAPTAFGPVSYRLQAVSNDRVTGTVDVPAGLGGASLKLRVRRPAGLAMTGVTVNGAPHGNFAADSGTIDLTGRSGHLTVEATFGASQGGTTTTVATTTTLAATTTTVAGATTTTTAAPGGATGAPTNLRVTSKTSSTVSLAWDAVPGATEYRAYASTTPGSGHFLYASGFTGPSGTLHGLGGTWYVVVRAMVGGVESGNSNEVSTAAVSSTTTTSPGATTTVPATTSSVPPATTTTAPGGATGAPTNLRVTSKTSSTVSLAWDAVPGATEYRAYASTTPGSGHFLYASGFTGPSGTLHGLGGTWYVVVRAMVGGVESGNSNEVSTAAVSSTTTTAPGATTTVPATTSSVPPTTTTNAPGAPAGAPANLRMTSRTASTASFAWDPVAGATEYRAYVSTTPGSGHFLYASGFPSPSATLHGLNGTWYVVVRALVGGAESPNSNEVRI